ncbi:MAG: hypothetical protein C4527_13725 [Candidatus Omnitrophota bacterium]|jgi:hypothetical protein|nr:MAG: hypothetical protein C4527_13725 [Candidatus Omnitrophota bacterium]
MIQKKQWIAWLTVFMVPYIAIADSPIGIHKTNFYALSQNGNPFLPVAANVGFLMDLSLSEDAVKETLHRLAAFGVNSIRVVIDNAYKIGEPLDKFEAFDGSLKEPVLARLDAILTEAEKQGMPAILALFDIESVARQWENHPRNKKNGGACIDVTEYLTKPDQVKRTALRLTQIVARYSKRNILAWELARGVNIWDLQTPPQNEYLQPIQFWIMRTVDQLRRIDDRKHLTALSYVPNSLPFSLMQTAPVDLIMLHIRSENPLRTAMSIQSFIDASRQYKKPIFIAETTWTGPSDHREEFTKNTLWSAAASCGAAFLMPQFVGDIPRFSNAELTQFKAFQLFLDNVDLGGVPRPPTPAPIQITPPDSYFIVESIVGNDRLFWVLRKNPGKSKDIFTFQTVEGQYEYLWFNTDAGEIDRKREFKLTRKTLMLDPPHFEHDIAGRLRLMQPISESKGEKKEKPNE